MIPGAVAYTCFGHAADSFLLTGQQGGPAQGPSDWLKIGSLVAGFTALLLYVPYFVKKYWHKKQSSRAGRSIRQTLTRDKP